MYIHLCDILLGTYIIISNICLFNQPVMQMQVKSFG